MENKSTIKYLDDILDSGLSDVKLHACGSSPFIVFGLNSHTKNVVQNILLDNEISIDVKAVAYSVSQSQLMVEHEKDGEERLIGIDFPLGHSKVRSDIALRRAIEMASH